MKSVCQLSLPGYVFSLLCVIPCIVFCIMNNNKLPELCASHFNIHNVPDGYLPRNNLFWTTIILSIGIVAFADLLSLLFLYLPLSAYNGLNLDYYRKNNRFNMLKSMGVTMTTVLGSITALFLFSVFEPIWEYNIRCDIDPDHPTSCDYKLVFWPQIVVFIVVTVTTIIVFVCAIAKRRVKEGLINGDEAYWKCGVCYVNVDDDRVCVPKRTGAGWTINLGNSLGIASLVCLVLFAIIVTVLVLLFQ